MIALVNNDVWELKKARLYDKNLGVPVPVSEFAAVVFLIVTLGFSNSSFYPAPYSYHHVCILIQRVAWSYRNVWCDNFFPVTTEDFKVFA